MAQSAQNPDVPLARGGVITDEILTEMLSLAQALETGDLSHEGGTLLLMNLRPALDELAKRRRIMSLVHAASDPDNVVYLTAP